MTATPTLTRLQDMYDISPDSKGAVGDGLATDTAAIAALLVASKYVRLTPGKNYLIDAPLVLTSGTFLDARGATITLKAGSNCNMLQNAALTAARSVADAAITAATATLTSATAAFVPGDAGATVVVWGAGVLGAPLVTTILTYTNATTVTLATNASTTVSGQALSVGPRDSRIEVLGGTWDNGNNGGTALNNYVCRFRRLDGIRIRQAKGLSSGGKYIFSLGDVTDFLVDDITFACSSDGVHIDGPATNGTIQNIGGTTGDDSVALTPYNYAANADVRGDITDVLIANIHTTTSLSPVKLLGGLGFSLKRITVKGIYGQANSPSVGAVWVGDDTGSANCIGGFIDQITVEDAKTITANGTPLVFLNGTNTKRVRLSILEQDKAAATAALISVAPASPATFTEVAVDRVRVVAQNQKPTVETQANATITRLLIDRLTVDAAAAGATLAVSNGGVITNLEINGFSAPSLTAGAFVVNVANTITSLTIRGAYLVSSAGNTNLVSIGAATLTDLTIVGYTGSVAASHVVSLANAASILTRVRISESHQTGGSSWVGGATSTHTVGTIELANCTGLSMSWVIADLATTTEIHVTNHRALSMGNGLINVRATGNLTIYGQNISIGGAAGAVIAAGGALRSKNAGLPFDVGLTGVAKNNGDQAYNTNSATVPGIGPVVCDGSNWLPMGWIPLATPAYSASITPVANGGPWQTITVTNGTAFTINAPTNPPNTTHTQELTIEISNTSGGAMGVITWNAAFVFTGGAFTNPATGFKRNVVFGWNGTKWVEKARAAADYA